MNINQIFDSEKVRKMRNLGSVVSAGSPLCYEQNQCACEWTAPFLTVFVRNEMEACNKYCIFFWVQVKVN